MVDDAALRLAPPVNAPYDLPVDLWVPGDFKDHLDVSRLEVEPGSTTGLVDEDDVIVREVLSDDYNTKDIREPRNERNILENRKIIKRIREHSTYIPSVDMWSRP